MTSNMDPQNMKRHPLPDKPKTQAQGRLSIAFLLEALERSQNANGTQPKRNNYLYGLLGHMTSFKRLQKTCNQPPLVREPERNSKTQQS